MVLLIYLLYISIVTDVNIPQKELDLTWVPEGTFNPSMLKVSVMPLFQYYQNSE